LFPYLQRLDEEEEIEEVLKGAFTMTMQSPRDLFLHEMADMYDAEQHILQMLPMLARECNNQQVQNALQQHERETRQQVTNLEQCFQLMNVQPAPDVTCQAVTGLKQEHDSFLREKPDPDILTMFDLGAAAKTEYYEMAAYRGLVNKAIMMGENKCADLLRQNLQQEEQMAQRVEMLAQELGQRATTRGQMGQTGQTGPQQRTVF
jgi:ferritin-like metal-binding protein YciE